MIVLYLFAIVLLFVGIGCKRNGFYNDFLDKEQANAIKGFFILTVVIGHVLKLLIELGYDVDARAMDSAAEWIHKDLKQLIVVMFLFYSGYGVMESIKSKGKEYLRSYPRKRLLTTLLNLDVAVVIFVVVSLMVGIAVTPKQFLLALVGWKTVGFSNWYIFVILCCYAITYISFMAFGKKRNIAAIIVVLLTIVLAVALWIKKADQHWWYDTVMCYPAGLLYSLYKEKLVAFCHKYYWLLLCGLLALFVFLHLQKFIPPVRDIVFNLKSIVFALLIVQLTMKVKIGNKLLYWLGFLLFPIYIYHWLPLVAFSKIIGNTWIFDYTYLFVLLCLATTFVIVYFYKYWQIKLK
ncbi:MAG: acyltransferase family protein [Bacteroidales bacterium]|nr:acyltransferase family protein [Bacteroidales bacterium]MBR5028537.1 acyltransferase family protein [Bacteroidales bacterium]